MCTSVNLYRVEPSCVWDVHKVASVSFVLRMPQSVIMRNKNVKEWDQKLHADYAVCATLCYVEETPKSCTGS